MRRLMSELQGDIESRGGSVALNSSAVSGSVSGMSHFWHVLPDTISVHASSAAPCRVLCTGCKVEEQTRRLVLLSGWDLAMVEKTAEAPHVQVEN